MQMIREGEAVVQTMMDNGMTTRCKYVTFNDRIWESLNPEALVDVVTGGKVQEPTQVRTCWDSSAFYVRFECRDDYVVSEFTNRDDPLYEQDVVEVFIDEEGTGRRYLELELSPSNVVFDAIIQNDHGKISLNTSWDADGLETSVHLEGDLRIYVIKLPFTNLQQTPQLGTKWRINFYRIDEDRNSNRYYQAWSPTGAVDYHIPACFGTLLFTK
jgi:hypothetical protein